LDAVLYQQKKGKMARSGSENRQQTKIAGARLTEKEHAYVLSESERTGIAVSDRIRVALLNDPAPRARPQPTINRSEVSRLIGTFGELSQALREAADTADQERITAQIEASHRDIADMCFACFKALGRSR
jgi:hypothetical protein